MTQDEISKIFPNLHGYTISRVFHQHIIILDQFSLAVFLKSSRHNIFVSKIMQPCSQIFLLIQFSSQGYKRKGPIGATCIDGRWSPDERPKCIPGKHPDNLYIFRGKRSLRQNKETMEAESQAQSASTIDSEVTNDVELDEIKKKIKVAGLKEQQRYPGDKSSRTSEQHKDEEATRRKVNKLPIKTKMKAMD